MSCLEDKIASNNGYGLEYTKNSKNLQIALAFFSELSLYIRNPNLLKFLKLDDFFLMATHFYDNHFLLYKYTSATAVEPSGVAFTTINCSFLLLFYKILLIVRKHSYRFYIFHSLYAEFHYFTEKWTSQAKLTLWDIQHSFQHYLLWIYLYNKCLFFVG